MAHFRTPNKNPALYYSSIAATLLEYAAATYFMMTLAQSPVTKAICFIIAIVVSTWTITMWSTVNDLIKRGNIVLALVVGMALNFPAFVYDVHGFLGVTSEVNEEYEGSTDVAKNERDFLSAQIESSKGLSKMAINPNDILNKISQLTAANNGLIANKAKCKNRWGNCAKDINKKIDNNKAEIETLNNSLALAKDSINANSAAKKSVQETLAGSNSNLKAHGVFRAISYWFYDSVDHAKDLQGKILGYSALFLSALVMFLPFLANMLCFEYEYQDSLLATTSENANTQNHNRSRSESSQQPAVSSFFSQFQNTPVEHPITTTAQATTPITTLATPPTNNDTPPPVQVYGNSELITFNDTPPLPVTINTTSRTILEGTGFSAREIPNPNYRPTVNLTRPYRVNRRQMTTPAVVIQQQPQPTTPSAVVVSLAKTTAKKKRIKRRGSVSLIGFNDIKKAIIDGRLTSISTRGIDAFVKSISQNGSGMGSRKATEIINQLISENVINSNRELIK